MLYFFTNRFVHSAKQFPQVCFNIIKINTCNSKHLMDVCRRCNYRLSLKSYSMHPKYDIHHSKNKKMKKTTIENSSVLPQKSTYDDWKSIFFLVSKTMLLILTWVCFLHMLYKYFNNNADWYCTGLNRFLAIFSMFFQVFNKQIPIFSRFSWL